MSDIYIVCMPFIPIHWPAMGIGQLVAAAKHAGMDVKAIYPSIWFAKTIGLTMYDFISAILRPYSQPHSLLAEWFFSGIAFKDFDFPHDEYLALNFSNNTQFLQTAYAIEYRENEAFFISEFKRIRETTIEFVKETAQQIVHDTPAIVGCSTSYMQYSSSLALLRLVKELNPSIVTMLGGADCEAEKGYITAKNFDWVDFVVSGDADIIFPDLCQKILEKGTEIPLDEIPYGVYCQKKIAADRENTDCDKEILAETACVENLDNIPFPDYREYFHTLTQANVDHHITRVLVAETSRGCWKGEKSPCNFCALNGKRIRYRAKSPEHVLQELEFLSKRHGITNFLMSDTMFNKAYFDNLLQELAQRNRPYQFFFETSSNLNEKHVKLLADAGVVWIQPGIESLCDELLMLLNKGTSAIHNIALLKYALEQGIKCTWFMLTDIPGGNDRYYQEMADFLPLLYHLEPPFIVRGIRFDRFSEYYRQSEQFGLRLSPLRNYRYVYPFTQEDLGHFASFFHKKSNSTDATTGKKSGLRNLRNKINEWRDLFYQLKTDTRPKLLITEETPQTVIYDSRPCAVSPEFILTDIERAIYKGCREPVTGKELYACLSSQDAITKDEHRFENSLRDLIDKTLVFRMNGRYLALAHFKPKREIPIGPKGF